MRKICVINQKGGVAKTTTAVSIAAGLARQEKRVLLVDLDPQGNVAHSLTASKRLNLYDFLMGTCSHVDCTTALGKNLDIIHSDESLTKIDVHLAKQTNPSQVISKKFADVQDYDYLIFDCAPSLGMLNQNALLFSDEALIPVSTTYLSLTGLTYMVEAIKELNNHFNHDLKISHIVPTLHDRRNRTNRNMLAKLMEDYGQKVTNPVRVNSKLAEAPASGKSIFTYAPKSRGAEDYGEVVKTIVANEKQTSMRTASQPISMRVQQMMADVEIED
ncbi:ParA family protein [Candidatus Woesearchaeota archaeon]|nr:ParA family protein [Candidatus Woesearchaeota archaeon]